MMSMSMSSSWDPWCVKAAQLPVLPRCVLVPSNPPPEGEPRSRNAIDNKEIHGDLISFLALVQNLEIDFLPITWHPAVETLGSGVTAEVRQALVDIQTSFAFKRMNLERGQTFRVLASEMKILSRPGVRENENIVKLLGIGWDVDPDGPTIWPVLVLEKASNGNLETFIQFNCEKRLTTSQVLGLLRDVGGALACLHAQNIIHGDVKPNNILIFQNDAGEFHAKLADFGYASSCEESIRIRLATPKAWTDSAYRGDYLDPKTAKKMEFYSFGLVCAWVLHQYSIARCPRSSEKLSAFVDPPHTLEDALVILERVPDLSVQQTCGLRMFFNLSFEKDVNARSTDFSQFPGLHNCAKTSISEAEGTWALDEERKLYSFSKTHLTNHGFQISTSIFRFLKADFRLPCFIAKQLYLQSETSQDEEAKSNAQLQLAICHAIGFGVRRDLEESSRWLSLSNIGEAVFKGQLEKILLQKNWIYRDSTLDKLEAAGTLDLLDPRFLQDAKNILDKIATNYKEQIEDYRHLFVPTHPIMVLTKFRFGDVLNKAGKYQEAYELYLELGKVMEDDAEGWGKLNRSTLITLTQAAGMAFKLGKYSEAKTLYLEVLERQTTRLGSQHYETLTTTDTLGLVFRELGDYRKAEEYGRRSVQGHLQALGDKHPQTFDSMGNLAGVLTSAGKFDDAKALLETSIMGRNKIYGKLHADTMIFRSNLSTIYRLQGNHAEAKCLAEEVFAEMEEHLGIDHPDSFYLIGNQISILHQIGDAEKALELGKRLLERQNLIGIDNPHHLTVTSSIALILQETGHYEESLKLDNDVLQRRTLLLGEHHPDTLLTRNNIAAALHRQGKYSEAKREYEAILSTRESILGESHPATLDTMANLAYLLQQMGEYESALSLHDAAVKGCTSALGKNHSITLLTKSNLGTLYLDLGKTEMAIDIFQETMEARIQQFKEDHTYVLQSMDNLAVALERLGRTEDAEKIFRQELKQGSKLGKDDLVILNAYNNLGMVLCKKDELEEARNCVTIALEGRKRVLGPHHLETMTALFNMGLINCRNERYKDAVEDFRTVVKQREILGKTHPHLLQSLKALAAALNLDNQGRESQLIYSDLRGRTIERFGEHHRETVDVSNRLAKVLYNLAKLDESSAILEQTVGSRDKIPDCEDVVYDAMALQALISSEKGEYDTARRLNECALRGFERLKGSENTNTLAVLTNLAIVALQRLDSDTIDLHRRVFEVREKTLGPLHSQTIDSLRRLATASFGMGHDQEALSLFQEAFARSCQLYGSANPISKEIEEEMNTVREICEDELEK